MVVGTAAVFGCAASPSLTRRFPLRIIVIFSSRFRFEYADDGEDHLLNDQQVAGDPDVDGMLIMANYAVTDAIGLTLRYSEIEYTAWNDPSAVAFDGSKFTISPSYVFTDNFSGLVEYSSYSKDAGTLAEPAELLGVEFIYTF